MNITAQNETLSIQEAADILQVSTKTLRRWEERGTLIPNRTDGNHRRYSRDQIASFIEKSHQKNHLAQKVSVLITKAEESFDLPHLYQALATEQKNVLKKGFAGTAVIAVLLFVFGILNSGGFAKARNNPVLLYLNHIKTGLLSYSSSLGLLPPNKTRNSQFAISNSDPSVLAANTSLQDLTFGLNIPAVFRKNATVEGNLTIASDVAIAGILNLSGTTLTSSGDLTIDAGGGGIKIGTGTPGTVDLAGDDLYVTGDLEVGGKIYGDGSSLTGISTYAGWDYYVGGSKQSTIASGNKVDFAAGSGITLSGESNKLTITASSTSSGWTDGGTLVSLSTTTDNVIIGGSTDLGKLGIDGDTDEIQLLVQGNSTQTSNLVVFENSSGTDLFVVDNSGNITTTGTTITASSATALNCSDCIDFDDMVDSPTLDATFNIGQGSNGWLQTYTGTTGIAFEYVAQSLTTGFGLYSIISNAATTNTQVAGTYAGYTNTQATTANTASVNGWYYGFTQNPTVAGNTEYAMRIQNEVTTNTTDVAVSALLYLNNADTTATGTTLITNAILIDSTPTSGTSAGITNAINISDTDVTTDLSLQNGETIDNNTDGTISMNPTTFTLSGTTTITASSATALNCSDCIDFDDMEDTLDLDANLTLNQTTSTWTQSFTGTTTTGLTYTATSLTTGVAADINITNTATTDTTIHGMTIDYTNAQGTNANTTDGTGLYLGYTQAPTVAGNTKEHALMIQNELTTNTTDNSVLALLYLNNADTTATGTTVVTNGILIESVPASGTASGFTNGISMTGTTITTDIVLQNGETIDNDTDGTITLSGALSVTSASSSLIVGALQVNGTIVPAGSGGIVFTNTTADLAFGNSESINNDTNGTISLNANSGTLTVDINGEVQLNLNNATSSTEAVCSTVGGEGDTNTVLDDCTTSVNADYMEMYPVENTVSMGDIVAPTNNTVTTTLNNTVARLAKATNPSTMIGIVSDKNQAGDFNSIGWNIRAEDNPQPVALNGRVPVKITPSSASIQPGDFITLSNEAGRGTKAINAGYVIGKALESWNPGTGQEMVMVFVNLSYYAGDINTMQSVASTPPSVPNPESSSSETFQDQITTLTEKTNLLETNYQNLSDQIATLSASLANYELQTTNYSLLATESATLDAKRYTLDADLTVLGKTTLSRTILTDSLSVGLVTINDIEGSIETLSQPLKLQPTGLSGVDILGGKVVIDEKGNLNLSQGHIIGNNSFRDTAIVKAGENTVVIEKTWDSPPVTINVTPNYLTSVAVENMTKNGFTIRVEKSSSVESEIYWIAMW